MDALALINQSYLLTPLRLWEHHSYNGYISRGAEGIRGCRFNWGSSVFPETLHNITPKNQYQGECVHVALARMCSLFLCVRGSRKKKKSPKKNTPRQKKKNRWRNHFASLTRWIREGGHLVWVTQPLPSACLLNQFQFHTPRSPTDSSWETPLLLALRQPPRLSCWLWTRPLFYITHRPTPHHHHRKMFRGHFGSFPGQFDQM